MANDSVFLEINHPLFVSPRLFIITPKRYSRVVIAQLPILYLQLNPLSETWNSYVGLYVLSQVHWSRMHPRTMIE